MNCVFCGGKIGYKEVTFIYEGEDKYIVIKNVPAEVCTRCGERMYSPEITDELLKFAQNGFKPTRTLDSLQLASALTLKDENCIFLTFDRLLESLFISEGLEILTYEAMQALYEDNLISKNR